MGNLHTLQEIYEQVSQEECKFQMGFLSVFDANLKSQYPMWWRKTGLCEIELPKWGDPFEFHMPSEEEFFYIFLLDVLFFKWNGPLRVKFESWDNIVYSQRPEQFCVLYHVCDWLIYIASSITNYTS